MSDLKSTLESTALEAFKVALMLKEELGIKSFYDGLESDKNSSWVYYYNLSGFCKGKYFSIFITKGRNQSIIEYSHNTEGRRNLNRILKTTLETVKR